MVDELQNQDYGMVKILQAPEKHEDENESDFRKRWAVMLQTDIMQSAHRLAADLWVIYREKLFLELGFSSIKAFMTSDMFPLSPGYGAKMISAIDRYHSQIDESKTIELIDELGVKRMYGVVSEDFDVKSIKDEVEFIHADSGTIVTASQLKDIGANESSETLKRLRRENATHRDNVDMLENEVEELKAQIRDADLHGRSPLELQKQLREKDLEIAQLRKQKLDDASIQNEIDKAVRNVRKFAGTLDEMLGETLSKDIELELHREVSSLFGIFNRMPKKVEAISIH